MVTALLEAGTFELDHSRGKQPSRTLRLPRKVVAGREEATLVNRVRRMEGRGRSLEGEEKAARRRMLEKLMQVLGWSEDRLAAQFSCTPRTIRRWLEPE